MAKRGLDFDEVLGRLVEERKALEKHGLADGPWLGLHGPTTNPQRDLNGRAIYCVDECICSHCNVYSEKLWEADSRIEALRFSCVAMFVLGLLLAAFAFHLGRGS